MFIVLIYLTVGSTQRVWRMDCTVFLAIVPIMYKVRILVLWVIGSKLSRPCPRQIKSGMRQLNNK